MSYTPFAYSNAHLSTPHLTAGAPLQLQVDLSNTGQRDGEETVEVYLLPKDRDSTPRLSLVAFRKVLVSKGASTNVRIEIQPQELSLVTPTGSRIIREGDYGSSSAALSLDRRKEYPCLCISWAPSQSLPKREISDSHLSPVVPGVVFASSGADGFR
jgi:beta-glucosidase